MTVKTTPAMTIAAPGITVAKMMIVVWSSPDDPAVVVPGLNVVLVLTTFVGAAVVVVACVTARELLHWTGALDVSKMLSVPLDGVDVHVCVMDIC